MDGPTCSGGFIHIGTPAECEKEAGELGISDTSAFTRSDSDFPHGCSLYADALLFFNTGGSTTGQCTFCDSSHKSICATGVLDV